MQGDAYHIGCAEVVASLSWVPNERAGVAGAATNQGKAVLA